MKRSITIDIPVYLMVLLFTTVTAFGSGRVISWGGNERLPLIEGEVSTVSAGYTHSLALTTSGVVVAWGDNNFHQLTIPATIGNNVKAISAGGFHSLAISSRGSVVAWGLRDQGQCSVPARVGDNATAISAGLMHSLALLNNGLVVGWGDNEFKQSGVPSGLNKVVAISAGAFHSMALRHFGDIVIWGDNSYGQALIPAAAAGQNIKAIAAGYYHSMALTTSGRVVAWGDNSYGQCNVPADAQEGVIAISAGQMHSMALKADGRLITWGSAPVFAPVSSKSASTPPVLDLSAGGFHSLAIIPSDLDTDGDGIPDWWEIQFGLDPYTGNASTTDTDGDGFSDLDEYLAGTDPTDDQSFFHINMAFDSQLSATRMEFGPVSSERTYVIEYATDLKANSWRAIPTKEQVSVEKRNGLTSIAINPSQDFRIYRVKIVAQ